MEEKVKGGSFQFECPRCKSLLEVPFQRKKFKCPSCGSSYGVNLQVEQQDQGNKEWKKRTLKEELQIFSKFERAMQLEEEDDGYCDRHEYSDDSCTKKFELLCMQCKKRICHPCNERIHMHPEFKHHFTMDRSIFDIAKKMFVDVVKTKGINGRIPAHILVPQISKYFRNPIRKIARALIEKDVDKFGKNYMISFEQFTTELAQFMTLEQGRKNHGMREHRADHLDKVKTELAMQIETEAWQDLNWFTRKLYDCQRRLEDYGSRREFQFWVSHIHEIQAACGASVASVFYFARWMFVLNFFIFLLYFGFIIIPGLSDPPPLADDNFIGLAIGHGLENSWMFYGGYETYYFHYRYNMEAAWVIINALMLFISLIATLVHMDVGRSNLKEDSNFAFSNLVFGGFDHQLTFRSSIELQRRFVHTSIEHLLIERKLDAARERKKINKVLNFNTRLIGRTASLTVAAFNIWLIYFLVQYEHNVLIPNWTSNAKYLLIPLLIALSKLIAPKFYYYIIRFEGYHRIGPELRHYFSRVLLLRVSYVVFVYVAVAQSNFVVQAGAGAACRETQIGVVFYRIFLADFFVEVLLATLYPFFRIYLIRQFYYFRKPLSPEHRTKITDDEVELLNEKSPLRNMRSPSHNNFEVPPTPAHREIASPSLASIDAHPAPERTESSFNLEQQYKDKFKEEFDIPTSIIDIMYRQALIWCGAPYSPMLPFWGMFFSFVLFFIKKNEVLAFTRRPTTPMGVARQNRFFRSSMITTMIISIIPFTFFLRRVVECGPHHTGTDMTVVDIFLADVQRLPEGVQVIVNYFTSVVLLWTLLTVGSIVVLTLKRRESFLHEEIKTTQLRLKLESAERKKIIEVYDVRIGFNEARGQELFKQWAEDLGIVGERYGPRLTALGYGDLVKLCKLTDDQLKGLLEKIECTPAHVAVMIEQLADKRQELVYLTVQT